MACLLLMFRPIKVPRNPAFCQAFVDIRHAYDNYIMEFRHSFQFRIWNWQIRFAFTSVVSGLSPRCIPALSPLSSEDNEGIERVNRPDRQE